MTFDIIESSFDMMDVTRNNILELFDACSNDEKLSIPNGFNNNIIWNIGHILSVQDGLTYSLAGLEGNLTKDFKQHFKKGSNGNSDLVQDVILEVRNHIISTSKQLKEDYNSGKFLGFHEYPTSYGYTIKSIQEAIVFNNIHESLHFGYCMAIRKALDSGTK